MPLLAMRLAFATRASDHGAVRASIDASEREDGTDNTAETLSGNETYTQKEHG
jgi:hypothetical protein